MQWKRGQEKKNAPARRDLRGEGNAPPERSLVCDERADGHRDARKCRLRRPGLEGRSVEDRGGAGGGEGDGKRDGLPRKGAGVEEEERSEGTKVGEDEAYDVRGRSVAGG